MHSKVFKLEKNNNFQDKIEIDLQDMDHAFISGIEPLLVSHNVPKCPPPPKKKSWSKKNCEQTHKIAFRISFKHGEFWYSRIITNHLKSIV